MKKKKKKPTRGKLIKILDSLFSKYLRMKYANIRGYCQCYTCNNTDHYKKLQCGHFISRSIYRYRWDEENCKVQCYVCNVLKSGNYKIYTLRMVDEYGRDKIDQMLDDKEIRKISTTEINEKIEYYKLRVLELEKNLEKSIAISK